VEAVIARLQRLRRLTAQFTFEDKFHNDGTLTTMPITIGGGGGRAGGGIVGTISPAADVDGTARVALLDGCGLWDTRWSAESAAKVLLKRDATVFNGERLERLTFQLGGPLGMILNTAQLPDSLVEVGLGLRLFEFPGPRAVTVGADASRLPWLTPQRIRAMSGSLDPAGDTVLKWMIPIS
jgi:hypothetical protein